MQVLYTLKNVPLRLVADVAILHISTRRSITMRYQFALSL